MKKQIITNRKVDFTFESEPCLLMREIVSFNGKNGTTKYIIQTSQCNYYPQEIQSSDENGELMFDESENPVIEEIQVLKTLAIKQKDGVLLVDKITSDALYSAVKNEVKLEDSYYDFQQQVELLALLTKTRMDSPYGTKPEDWIILE